MTRGDIVQVEGTLTAYVLLAYRFPGKRLLNLLIDLPFSIPTLVTLWALGHIEALPAIDEEFEVAVLNQRIEAYGSESAFRTNGRLRDGIELDRAWGEADAWLAATDGMSGEDATIASISAERRRALSWLRDRGAAPA